MHETPGSRFSPSTTTFRRRSKARIMLSTSSCGPSIAAMPAYWLGALTQDQQFTASLRTLS
jgi:hypothetical protein